MSLVVAFTGHRPDKLGFYGAVNPVRDALVVKLAARLRALQVKHADLTCISGMALGFDQWAAETCVGIGIPFEAAIPFAGQESRWPTPSQVKYRNLLARAAKVHIVCAGGYSALKMQRRNEWMVDRCGLLIAAWDGSLGGTKNCVDYAKRIGRTWENLIR